MIEFLMPKLGADMAAGTLAAWHKRPGDAVQRGDVIAAVDTDKGVIDVEVFTSGVIEKLLVQPGDKAPVGAPLALLREAEAPAEASAAAQAAVPAVAAPRETPTRPSPRIAISPSARRLARELGVDPATLQGTGPGGAITRDDISQAAAAKPAKPAEPPPGPADRGARMRQAIAAAMSLSKREIPHYYLSTTIDMQAAIDWLESANASRPLTERLLPGVLLLKATALALREVPELNAWWTGAAAPPLPGIHLGVAISLREGGLVAPAIHDADKLPLADLMRQFRDLVSRARSGSLRSSELADATITVTSLGEQGVESAYGIIYPPQVAIVGFGAIVQRPWAVGGRLVARQVVTATLSGDHRATDGHRGGRLLAALSRLLREPAAL